MNTYAFKTNNGVYELENSFNAIKRIQTITGKSIEGIQADVPNLLLDDKIKILAQGIQDTQTRREFLAYANNEGISPFQININLQMYMIELLTIGMSDEEVEKYFPKKDLMSMLNL